MRSFPQKIGLLQIKIIIMAGFLFHDIIFGPIRSRRLGLSLGINLLPLHKKHCSFNCIYCECGWTPDKAETESCLPSREIVSQFLEIKLKELAKEDHLPDALTFAGNGEPTMHPDFAGIVSDTINLRNQYSPGSKVSVLTNSSMLSDQKVFEALLSIDNNICKLDAGSEKVFKLMNKPVHSIVFSEIIENLKRFNGKVTIQSMFLRGLFKNEIIDNTPREEVGLWLNHLKSINPELVMIYPIARETPAHHLEIIPPKELEEIAEKVREMGLAVKVYQ